MIVADYLKLGSETRQVIVATLDGDCPKVEVLYREYFGGSVSVLAKLPVQGTTMLVALYNMPAELSEAFRYLDSRVAREAVKKYLAELKPAIPESRLYRHNGVTWGDMKGVPEEQVILVRLPGEETSRKVCTVAPDSYGNLVLRLT